jgi:hypothetical protein
VYAPIPVRAAGPLMRRFQLFKRALRRPALEAPTAAMPASDPPAETDPKNVDVPREFHRRMAAIIEAVQTGIWEAGVHDLVGYATDYAFGDKRGLQTLVLKISRRSAYVRLQWETIMSDSAADTQAVHTAIHNAVRELT